MSLWEEQRVDKDVFWEEQREDKDVLLGRICK
jgi:hypothetical protein